MDYIKLSCYIGEHEGMELWEARVFYDGHAHDGYALVGPEDCDWYENDPRELDERTIATTGMRLPSYMPGHKPDSE
ncbi:MAG: hypothetical protein WCY82_11155 [Desulfotomaculaceae bacterium]